MSDRSMEIGLAMGMTFRAEVMGRKFEAWGMRGLGVVVFRASGRLEGIPAYRVRAGKGLLKEMLCAREEKQKAMTWERFRFEVVIPLDHVGVEWEMEYER